MSAAKEDSGTRKKKKVAESLTLNNLNEMATSATKALLEMSSRQEKRSVVEGGKGSVDDKFDDSDYVFSMLVYRKMKEIPDGSNKDDLQVEIQRLINKTKRSSAVIYEQTGSSQQMSSYEQGRYPYAVYQSHQPMTNSSNLSSLLQDTQPYQWQNQLARRSSEFSQEPPSISQQPFAPAAYPSFGSMTPSQHTSHLSECVSPQSDISSV